MQVPESFFYSKPSTTEVGKKEPGKSTTKTGDDSFKKVLNRESRQSKGDVDFDTEQPDKTEIEGEGASPETAEGSNEGSIFDLQRARAKQATHIPGKLAEESTQSHEPMAKTPSSSTKTSQSQPRSSASSGQLNKKEVSADKVEGQEFAQEEAPLQDTPDPAYGDEISWEEPAQEPFSLSGFEEASPPPGTPLTAEQTHSEELPKEMAKTNDPSQQMLRQDKELPKPAQTIQQAHQAPDKTQQEQRLDQNRQLFNVKNSPQEPPQPGVPLQTRLRTANKQTPEFTGHTQAMPNQVKQENQAQQTPGAQTFVFVERKRENPDQSRNPLFDYGSHSKPASNGGTSRTVVNGQGQEIQEVEKPVEEVISGKIVIKEQEQEPAKTVALPGSKKGEERFQQTLEHNQGEIRNAMGLENPVNPATKKNSLTASQEFVPSSSKTKDSSSADKMQADAKLDNRQEVKQRSSDEENSVDFSTHPKTKDSEKPVKVIPSHVAFNPDLVAPQAPLNASVAAPQPVEKPPLSHKLQELVTQLVKEIQSLELEGKDQTTLILQHPPLFAGVKVTIETFKQAHNELNITFSNLTGPGKRLLDENLASLKANLEQSERGFVVHQLIATTVDTTPIYTEDAQSSGGRGDQDGGDQQQQRSKKGSQNEDEMDT